MKVVEFLDGFIGFTLACLTISLSIISVSILLAIVTLAGCVALSLAGFNSLEWIGTLLK